MPDTQLKPARLPGGLHRAALALMAVFLAACGAGDGTSLGSGPQASGCSGNDCGTAMVSLTDAEGDFLSYTVDITSLELKKANGSVVQTLPQTARVDFAQLVDLNEILSAGQIPAGEYVAAALKVNFTDSQIVVDDGSAAGVEVDPVDANGQPLGTVELAVQLDNRNRLRINAGRIAHLAFDLNLLASNTVNLTSHTVTVSPFVVATVLPPESRQTRVRGRLASVDISGGSYTVDLRPFHENSNYPGQMVVHTTAGTSFEINGTVSTGAAGLALLATHTDKPMVIAFGTMTNDDHVFTARRVLAGSSIEDARRDYLSGNVLSRSGNTLEVGGVTLARRDGRHGFERSVVTVTLGAQTRVTRAGQGAGTLAIGAISVGQRIEAMGELSRSGETLQLDATEGAVRLDYTRLFGTVAAVVPGSLTLSLDAIDGRDPARFDFTGTGATAAQDADPESYEVATGALATTGLAAGAYTRLFGFVTPFGAAPPDFEASSFVDFTETYATLGITWGVGGSVAPFTTASATGLTLNLGAAVQLLGGIQLGGHLIDLRSLTTGLTLVPAASDRLSFAIAHRVSRKIDNFSDFAEFSTALAAGLDGSTAMTKLVAYGQFNAVTGSFTARQLLVVLAD
jgi:hypothetical protein